jgi:acyl carrier protein
MAEFFSDSTPAETGAGHKNLTERIKALIVETLMLQTTAAELKDDQALFGPDSLALDSVDALQLVVMLDKHFGIKVADPAAAQEILQSVATIVATIEKHQGSKD